MPTSMISRPVDSRPARTAAWMRGEDRRQSRPSVMRRAPPSTRNVPMARPRLPTNSSGKSLSATPRMSYSLKTRGLKEVISPRGLRGFDDLADVLRQILAHHQDGVGGGDDDQVLGAHHADERRARQGDDDAALGVVDGQV